MNEWACMKKWPLDTKRATLQLIGPQLLGTDPYLTYEERVVAMSPGTMHCRATHWMPLPDPPAFVHERQRQNAD